MNTFSTIDFLKEEFTHFRVTPFNRDTLMVEGQVYSASPMGLTVDGLPIISLYPSQMDQPIINLMWHRVDATFFPYEVTTVTSAAVVESVNSDIVDLVTEDAQSCEVLEHRATIGGAVVQMKIDDSITHPVLHINMNQFVSGPVDPESCLPTMGKLTLNESSVFVYEDSGSGELIIPTIVLDTLNGSALHDVRVKTEHTECTHLAIPKSMLNLLSS